MSIEDRNDFVELRIVEIFNDDDFYEILLYLLLGDDVNGLCFVGDGIFVLYFIELLLLFILILSILLILLILLFLSFLFNNILYFSIITTTIF